ncbi:BolA/IbaG family iron-sulfur metabolism protein [Maritalea porphyrae]|jgi:acid stress-induced BolA-like protein IbaG/YrbA|uniref:BolA family protein n=1 Tax=Maritalea porphyrae TaxID=880732 RepID=UPI0022B07077|nr:BolA/IbaG family iron-sulfur metabolism protein [Maritalea porphyrae]MCZ4272751.1 BolA/IbaG family iron-sulfur metabolism protein [Maritalea porphyrae]
MSIGTAEIERLILTAIPDAKVHAETDDGHHYTATVVAEAFKGKTRVQQHQMVNAALKSVLDDGSLHALALKTNAPE